MRLAPWQAHPAVPPSSSSWKTGLPESELDDWVRWFIALDGRERKQYLDERSAPAMWRRWLDGYVSGKWDNPPAIYFHPDAPMRRMIPADAEVPDRLERLVELLEAGGDPMTWRTDPGKDAATTLAELWRTTDSPWGLCVVVRRLRNGDLDAINRLIDRVERGQLMPNAAAQQIRTRTTAPTWDELLQTLRPR